MIVLYLLAFIVGLLLIKLICTWIYVTWTDRPRLDYAPGCMPLIGHVITVLNRDWMNSERLNWYDKYDGVFGLRIFFSRLFITRDIHVWEDLLSNQKYITKAKGYWVLRKFLGDGLLTGTGDLWKQRRRIITPAFHFDILNDFLGVMENRTLELIRMLEQGSKYRDSAFNIFEVTKPFSLSIICETSMGITLSIEETNSGRFKQLYEELVTILFARQINPFMKSDWLYSWTRNGKVYYKTYAALKAFVDEIIQKRLELRKNPTPSIKVGDGEKTSSQSRKRKIFIDSLLDAYEKEEIDVEGILNEVNTFVNAGYETTSTGLAWALYCVARNKDAQDKLYKEVSDFRKKRMEETSKSSSLLKMSDFKEMPYLDLVVKESLRLHAPIPRFGRQIEDGTVLGGKEFPECSVIVDVLSMNRNPSVWKDPLSFIPERFDTTDGKQSEVFQPNNDDEDSSDQVRQRATGNLQDAQGESSTDTTTSTSNKMKRSPFLYIPFSAGPRNCIGQRFALSEMKAALFHLVGHFEWSSQQNEEDLQQGYDLIHSCANGPMLNIKPR